MTPPVRVVVAEDDPLYRHAVCTTLSSLGNADVVAEATTGEEAVTTVAQQRPDVVIMDIRMPGLDGIEATRRIVESRPEVAVLMLTMFEDDDSVFAAMRAGARGYVVKGADEDEIVRALAAVAAGEAVFSAAIAQRILRYFSGTRVPTAAAVPFPELTDREREVLELVAAGHNNATIATRLYLSPKTVRNHVSNIFTKLQVADRAEAIVRARRAGLGESTGPPPD
ncbi:MAG: response regulator transcription factor [Actinomycetota bacterium]|nr:response regulator transcription factor [Actinomycetota bacterium]